MSYFLDLLERDIKRLLKTISNINTINYRDRFYISKSLTDLRNRIREDNNKRPIKKKFSFKNLIKENYKYMNRED